MRNIFIEKLYTKYYRETSSRLFSRKSILSMPQQSETLYSLLLLYLQVMDYKNILKPRCWPIVFTSYKAFSKNKNNSATGLLIFSSIFQEKYLAIMLYSIHWQNFIVWLPLLLEILCSRCVYCNYLLNSWWRQNFEIKLSFSFKQFPYRTIKAQTKN